MADRLLFKLSDGYALGADDNQWMLMRGRKRHADAVWQPVAYIASTKANLLLCMAENGVQLTVGAQAQLGELSEHFLDWRAATQNTAATRSAA